MQSISLPMTDYSRLDDAALVREACHNTEAFSALYRRYVTPLYRYLYRRLGNVKDAEDLTAQVFADALEGLASYRERGRFSSWLFTIAHRRLVDQYRQHATASLNELTDDSPDLQSTLEQNELHAHLAQLLGKLDEERQELLRLRFAAGLDFSEIASMLKRSEGAVKMSKKPTPHMPDDLEKELKDYYASPEPSPEFVSRLERGLHSKLKEQEQKTMFGRSKVKLAWGFGLALAVVLIILLATSPTVVTAMKRLLGYIPGVGLVDSTSPLRVLAEPVSQT